MNWCLSFVLDPDGMRSFDPLDLSGAAVTECPDLSPHRTELHTVVAELYANALEYGVLGLDAGLKDSAEGFEEYYRRRQVRLADLNEGWIRIGMEARTAPGVVETVVRVKDSGAGFDWQSASRGPREQARRGRGIGLVRGLCEQVTYNDNGTEVEAVYRCAGVGKAGGA